MTSSNQWQMSLGIVVVMSLSGCSRHDDRDQRLAQLAQHTVAEQSRQNERSSQLTQEIAQASKRLVESDAESRRQFLDAQRNLQAEIAQQRQSVDVDRDAIELERKDLAIQRERAPIIANTLMTVGTLIAALLPLTLSIYLLRYLATSPEPSADLSHLLVEEIASQCPRLLPPPSTDDGEDRLPALGPSATANSNDQPPS